MHERSVEDIKKLSLEIRTSVASQDWLVAVAAISSALSDRIDIRASLRGITSYLASKCDLATAVVVTGPEGESTVVSNGFTGDFEKRFLEVFRQGHRLLEPVRITKLAATVDYPLWSNAAREGVTAMVARPLETSNRIVGEVLLGVRERSVELPPDSFMTFLARSLAMALEREELFREHADSANAADQWRKALGDSLAAGAAGGILVTDIAGIALMLNEEGERILKVTQSDVIGKVVGDHYPMLAHMMDRGLSAIARGEIGGFEIGTGQLDEVFRVGVTSFDYHERTYVIWNLDDDSEKARLTSTISQQQTRYNSLLDRTPLGVFSCDTDGIVTDFNSVLPRLFSFMDKKIEEGDNILERNEFEKCGISETVRACMIAGKPLKTNHEIRDKRFGVKFLSVQATPLESEDGGYIGVQTLVEDTTEHEAMKRSMILSEERYRTFFENAPIGLAELDFSEIVRLLEDLPIDGQDVVGFLSGRTDVVETMLHKMRIVAVNEASLRLYEAKDMMELMVSIPKIVSKDRFKEFAPLFEMLVGNGSDCCFETIITNLAGRRMKVSANIAVAPGHENDYSKVLVSVVDTTKLREIEEELRLSEDMLRTVFASMGSGVLVTDGFGKILMANPSARKTLQISDDFDLLGKYLADIAKGGESLLTDSSPGEQRQVVLTLFDGAKLNVGFTSAASISGANRIVVFRDLTKIIEANKRQHRAEQLAQVGMMAAKLSHEIKNPITSILLGLRTLENNEDLKEQDAFLVRSVLEEVRFLKSLVGNLLDSMRLKEVAPKLDRIEPLVKACFESQAHLAAHKGVALSIVESSSSTQSYVDKEAMTRVLSNLVQNALEACNDGNSVEMGWRELDKEEVDRRLPGYNRSVVCIYIQDNGPGMPRDVMDNLFIPFTTTKSRGTGLGLSVVREVVLGHGGIIEVATGIFEGHLGTRFEILLASGERSCCLSEGTNGCSGPGCPGRDNCPVHELGSYHACWVVNGRASLQESGRWNDECLTCKVYLEGALENYYRRPTDPNRRGM